jgi:hypothetical protein
VLARWTKDYGCALFAVSDVDLIPGLSQIRY